MVELQNSTRMGDWLIERAVDEGMVYLQNGRMVHVPNGRMVAWENGKVTERGAGGARLFPLPPQGDQKQENEVAKGSFRNCRMVERRIVQ